MSMDQGPDCPCKKQRTVFRTQDEETGENSSREDDPTSPDNAAKMDIEIIGPVGDMIQTQARDQPDLTGDLVMTESRDQQGELIMPGMSGDNGNHQISATTVNTHNSHTDNSRTISDQGPVNICGQAVNNRIFTDNYSVMQNSTAIAENAYIKSKECKKLSGDQVESRSDLPKPSTSTSDQDVSQHSSALAEALGASAETLECREQAVSDEHSPVIAFDRADFEFDFYGRGTRQEEDGTLISPPEYLNDTGFIEMFSNSVMGSVLNTQGKGTQGSGIGSRPWLQTGPLSSCSTSSDLLFEPVKQSNVPFVLDSEYMDSIINQQNINSLPQSLMVHIFKSFSPCMLLRRVSVVCKYWYNVCRDPDLWRTINFRNQYKLNDATLVQMLEFSDRVLHVNLNDCRFVSDAGIRRLLLRCQHIQSLKLMRCFDLTDSSFIGMGSQRLCSTLNTLHLDGCCKITDVTVVEISEACPNMKSLHLNQCTKITDIGVISLAQHCHSVTQLLLDHCGKVTDKGLSELVLGCPDITYLNIMLCGVTDTGIKMLAKLQHLTNLDVSNIPLMTPASIGYVSRYCKKLDCINISLNSVIDDNCVAELARNLPSLLRLYCVSCSITDTGLTDIARYRPTLEALDVGWCQDITDQGVRVISHSCKKLDYFGLIRCDKVTVETIEELVLRYPRVNFSTFILESRRLLERARREGYLFGL